MKRLIRKASNQITLYHGTSLELFRGIINDGKISPREDTGNISNMGDSTANIAVWYKKNEVHENNEKSIDFNESSISLYDGVDLLVSSEKTIDVGVQIDDKFVNASDDLKDYIKSETMKVLNKYQDLRDEIESDDFIDLYYWDEIESKLENEEVKGFVEELRSHEISIVEKTYNSNVDDYVVFLGTKEVATSYTRNLNDVGVLIEVSVDESNLGPDMNDAFGSIDFFSDTPLWKQTHDAVGQVIQYGPVDASQITSITFVNEENSDDDFDFEEDDIMFEDFEDFDDIPEEPVDNEEVMSHFTFNQALSLDEAINEVNMYYQTAVQAQKVTRLKKQSVI